VGFH